MDYEMKISVSIDTEARKDVIRDFIKSKLETEYDAGNINSWNITISGIVVPSEDNESYSSPSI